MKTGILLFAHGARDPHWARPVERLKRMLAERMPAALVAAAYLEHMDPTLEQAADEMVAQGATLLSVVPVFIAKGSHLQEDLPVRVRALEAKHPGIPVRVAPAIGEVDTILSSITAWIEELHPPN